MVIDRAGLAEFMRRRRKSLQPEDVGLLRGPRRRTGGLRREEVAALCHMSADYYARLERERGPQPSAQMVTSIAQGLGLCLDERDHLLRLSGHNPPARGAAGEHVSSGLLRILDRLDDSPAEIVTELGETLRQSSLGIALTGDRTRYSSAGSPPVCATSPLCAAPAPGRRSWRTSCSRRATSFREAWNAHEVGVGPVAVKHFVHPEVSALELTCQTLLDPDQSHRLLVFAAVPDSESDKK